MSRTQFELDANGFPVIEFANVANSGVVITRRTGSQGGNPKHDKRSGKFAPGGEREARGPERPDNINPLDFKRMLDAARDAAREMDLPEEGDIKEFLAGRAKNPGQVDIPGFLALVKEQKLSDLVDIIDQEIRTRGSAMKTGRRRVRVVSPKGYVRRAFAALAEGGVAELMHRLEARGHDEAEVEAFVLGKAKPDKHDSIRERKIAIAASDEIEPESWWLMSDEIDEEEAEEPPPPPLPNIEINLSVPKPGKTRMTPVRDKSTGMIQYTLSEPLEDADAS